MKKQNSWAENIFDDKPHAFVKLNWILKASKALK